jgi:hypothetical protein
MLTINVKKCGLRMDLNSILEFSRQNCVGICAFLVPANLIATLQTLILGYLNPLSRYLHLSVVLGISFALLQIAHVASWFIIGVVTPVTFILISLSSVCLFLNLWTVFNPLLYRSLINSVIRQLSPYLSKLSLKS